MLLFRLLLDLLNAGRLSSERYYTCGGLNACWKRSELSYTVRPVERRQVVFGEVLYLRGFKRLLETEGAIVR